MLLHVHRGQPGPNFQIFQRWHRDHRRWSLQIDQRWRKQQYDNVDHRKSKGHRRGRVPSLHRKLSRVRRKEFHALCIRYVTIFMPYLKFKLFFDSHLCVHFVQSFVNFVQLNNER